MTVITLSRELGSLGDDVALAVAARLNLRVVGRDVINRAARAAGAPEVALAEIDELGLLGVRPSAAARAQYCEKIASVIQELAAEGNLFLVGRAGQVVLADHPGTLHVRIIAPIARRIAVVRERAGIGPGVASARVEASDKARAAFLRQNYGVKWDDPLLYGLILNMDQLDIPAAVEAICGAYRETKA